MLGRAVLCLLILLASICAEPEVKPCVQQVPAEGSGEFRCKFPNRLIDCKLRVSDHLKNKFDEILYFGKGVQSRSIPLLRSKTVYARASYAGDGLEKGHCGVKLKLEKPEVLLLIDCFGQFEDESWDRGIGLVASTVTNLTILPSVTTTPGLVVAKPGSSLAIFLKTQEPLDSCFLLSPSDKIVELHGSHTPPRNRYKVYGAGTARGDCGTTRFNLTPRDAGIWYVQAGKNTTSKRTSTAFQAAIVLIEAAPKNDPVLVVEDPNNLKVGDFLSATCSAPPAIPAAKLTWLLDGQVFHRHDGNNNLSMSWLWLSQPMVQTFAHMLRPEDNGKILECRMGHSALPGGHKSASYKLRFPVSTVTALPTITTVSSKTAVPQTVKIPTPTPPSKTTTIPTTVTTSVTSKITAMMPTTTPKTTSKPLGSWIKVTAENPVIVSGDGYESELACIVDAQPEATVEWSRAGKPVQMSALVRKDNKGNRHCLLLGNTAVEDLTEFKCTANNEAGSASAVITLTGLPGTPEWQDPTEESLLTWRVESVAPIIASKLTYRKTGRWKILKETMTNPEGSDEVDRLQTVERKKPSEHRGKYQAYLEVQNMFGWSKPSTPQNFMIVTVSTSETLPTTKQTPIMSTTQPPTTPKPWIKVTAEKPVIHSAAGYETELACIVDAMPEASVMWSRAGTPVQMSPLVIEGKNKTRHWLRIENTAVADLVTYTCTASNEAGSASENITLTGLPGTPVWAGPKPHLQLAWRVESVAKITGTQLSFRQSKNWDSWNILEAVEKEEDERWHRVVLRQPPVSPGNYTAYLLVHNEYGWSAPSKLQTISLVGSTKSPTKPNPEKPGESTTPATSCDPLKIYSMELESSTADVDCEKERAPLGTVVGLKCRQGFKPRSNYPGPLETTCTARGWLPEPCKCDLDCGHREDANYSPQSLGGKIASESEFPWQVAIFRKKKDAYILICGGSLITPRFFVSAAHCFRDDNSVTAQPKTMFKVAVGKHTSAYATIDPDEQRPEISDIILHHGYKGPANHYEADIALVKLSAPITVTHAVSIVCMDWMKREEDKKLPPENGTVPGWGIDETNKTPAGLRFVELPYVPNEECRNSLKLRSRNIVTNTKICGGYKDKTVGTCSGDSGGGFVFPYEETEIVRYYLKGITSCGPRRQGQRTKDEYECYAEHRSVFTKISSYVDWIKKLISDAVDCDDD